MTTAGDRAGFVHVLRALGEGIVEVMVVGGWAHRLHAHHPLAAPAGSPLHTTDADLFVPSPAPTSAIRVASLVSAGFEVRLGGLDATPVTKYVLRSGIVDTTAIQELEFLAHRRGAEVIRGRPNTTTRVGDAVAQLLPHLDVMSHEPWLMRLGADLGYPTGDNPIAIQVVSPGPYIAHKMMVLPERRNPKKREQDVRYVYETFMRFGRSLDEISATWRARRTTPAERKRLTDGRRLALSRDLIVAAARIADLEGKSVMADRMAAVIEAGSAQMFDG